MKCISLWQPWASLLVAGVKKIETRSWLTGYRGPLYISRSKEARQRRSRPVEILQHSWFKATGINTIRRYRWTR